MAIKMNMKDLWMKIKIFFTKVTYYSVVAISLGVGFALGFYYNIISDIKIDKKPKITTKSEVSLAVDENSNLLIINRKDGSYVVYQDSIGYKIFNLYARNMFGQHSPAVSISDKK
jgi:hypothetical protein